MGLTPATGGWIKRHKTAITSAQTGPAVMVDTSSSTAMPSGFMETLGMQTLKMRFFGDTDGETATVTIFSVDVVGAQNAAERDSFFFRSMGTLAIVTGTQTGLATSKIVNGTELFCDQAVWSTNTWGTYIINGVGGSILTVTAADDNIAEVTITDTANMHGVVVMFTTMAGNYMNFLYKLDVV